LDNGFVTITVDLAPGFVFDDVFSNLKVQGYSSKPSGNPSPGEFANKTTCDVSSDVCSITVPEANYYGIHADLVNIIPDPCSGPDRRRHVVTDRRRVSVDGAPPAGGAPSRCQCCLKTTQLSWIQRRWSTMWGVAVAAITALVSLVVGPVAGDAPQSPCTGSRADAPGCAVAGDPPVRGRMAVQRLGDRLPDVARAYGWTALELEQELVDDETLWLDGADQLFYVEDDHVEDDHVEDDHDEAADATAVTSDTEVLPAPSTVDAFQLASRPGAKLTIFLDVDGHVTEGTSWNGLTGDPSMVSAPYDTDGDPSTFNAQERDMIHRWWLRVAEDFAPWEVNVTTVDPGVEALRKTSSTDVEYGVRAVITPTNWRGSAGVAYVGSFTWNTDTPVFIFNVSSGERAGDTVAHEVGHALGLRHDGTTTGSAYYTGHGSWRPIMGSGSRTLAQWSKGEYPNANNTEDDLEIISSRIPLRNDDHGDTFGTATVLPNSFEVAGVLRSRTDVDVFRVSVGTGPLSVLARPAFATNADLRLTLVDAGGTTLAVSDPLGTGAPQIDLSVTAGTYYLQVDGVGWGDLTTGYSDYASLGRFVLIGAGAEAAVSTDPPQPATTTIAPASTTTTTVAPTSTTTTTVAPASTTTSTTTALTSPPQSISLQSVAVRAGKGRNTAVADIVVYDTEDRPVAGAIVVGRWSGPANGDAKGETDQSGLASTPKVKFKGSGTLMFTVTDVLARGTAGIRTRGGANLGRFQGGCIRPLCHRSGPDVTGLHSGAPRRGARAAEWGALLRR
jgi:hypothetical protein